MKQPSVETALAALLDDPLEETRLRELLDAATADGGIEAIRTPLLAGEPAWQQLVVLGLLDRAVGDLEPALERFDAARALAPSEGAPVAWKARVLLELERIDEALAAYEAASGLARPAWRRAELVDAWATVAVAAKKFESARSAYDLRIESGGGLDATVEAAQAFAGAGQLALSEEYWSRVAQLSRRNRSLRALALTELGSLADGRGDTEVARKTWNEALTAAAKDPAQQRDTWDRILSSYRRTGELELLASDLKARSGRDFEVAMRLGGVLQELGRAGLAADQYRAAVRLRPKSVQARQALIRMLEGTASPAEVIAEYERLLGATRGETSFRFEFAELLLRLGERDRAEKLAKDLRRQHWSDATTLGRVSELYLRLNLDRDQLEALLKRLRALEPNEEAHLLNLGEFYFDNGKLDRAISVWKGLLRVNSDAAEGHFRLAQTAARHDLRALALEQFEKSIRVDSQRADVRRAFARVLEKQRRIEPAITQLRAVETLCADDALCAREAREEIVRVWARAKRLDEEVARLVIEVGEKGPISPEQERSARLLVQAWIAKGQLDGAVSVLERVAVSRPRHVPTLIELEAIYLRLNRPQQAEATAKRLVDADPQNRDVHLRRIAAYKLSSGEVDDAVSLAMRLIRLRPTDPRGHVQLGDAYWQLGDRGSAESSYLRAVELGSADTDLVLRIAGLYREAKRTTAEMELLLRSLEGSFDPVGLSRMGSRLVALAAANGQLAEAERRLRPLTQDPSRVRVFRGLYIDVLYRMASASEFDAKSSATRALVAARASRPVVEALADDDVSQRARLLKIVMSFRISAAVLPLTTLMRRADKGLRRELVAAMAHIGADSATSALVPLIGASDEQTAQLAIWALGALDGPQSSAALVALADRALTDKEAQALALAAGQRRLVELAPKLRRLLKNTEAVRVAALIGLGGMGSAESLDVVLSHISARTQLESEAAVWAVARLSGPRARLAALRLALGASPDRAADAVAGLFEATGVARDGGREAYLRVVGSVVAEPIVFHLQSALARAAKASVSGGWVRGLEDDIRNAARRILTDQSTEERLQFLRGAIHAADPGRISLNGFGALCSDDCAEVQSVAEQVFEASATELESQARFGEGEIRVLALRVLCRLDSLDAGVRRRAVEEALVAFDEDARIGAIAELVHRPELVSAAALDATWSNSRDGDWALRAAWLDAGAASRHPETVSRAQANLTSRYATVRAAAYAALGVLRGAEATPLLVEGLADPSDRVVRRSLFQLGRVADEAAVAGILAAVRERSMGLIELAATIAVQIRSRSAGPSR